MQAASMDACAMLLQLLERGTAVTVLLIEVHPLDRSSARAKMLLILFLLLFFAFLLQKSGTSPKRGGGYGSINALNPAVRTCWIDRSALHTRR
jgi:hypothetical protein